FWNPTPFSRDKQDGLSCRREARTISSLRKWKLDVDRSAEGLHVCGVVDPQDDVIGTSYCQTCGQLDVGGATPPVFIDEASRGAIHRPERISDRSVVRDARQTHAAGRALKVEQT